MSNPLSDLCVILSDYPIKAMGYIKYLANLGEFHVAVLNTLPTEQPEVYEHAKLLVVDMNWSHDGETEWIGRVLAAFPQANVLFMEEEHADIRSVLENNGDVCLLGKLAPVSLTKSAMRTLLHCPQKPGRQHALAAGLANSKMNRVAQTQWT